MSEMTSMEFVVETKVSMDTLWEAIWGSDGSGITYWCSMIRKPDGSDIRLWTEDWKPNVQDFKLYDTEGEEWYTVTVEDLQRGYKLALEQKLTHCGDCLVSDLEDSDECTGDVILQLAIFGEVVFG